MATTKLTVTLKADDELPPEAADRLMTQALELLTESGTIPLRGITLTLETPTEEAMIEARDELRVLLTGRPIGVDAKLKMTTDEDVVRERMVKVTPMDRIQGFADKYGTTVELHSGGEATRLTPRG